MNSAYEISKRNLIEAKSQKTDEENIDREEDKDEK
jgi:hypothetical protein